MELTFVNVCKEDHSICFHSNGLRYLLVALFISLTTSLCVKMPTNVLKQSIGHGDKHYIVSKVQVPIASITIA